MIPCARSTKWWWLRRATTHSAWYCALFGAAEAAGATSTEASSTHESFALPLNCELPRDGGWRFEFRQGYRAATRLVEGSSALEQSDLIGSYAVVPLRMDLHRSDVGVAWSARRWLALSIQSGFQVRRIQLAHLSGRQYEQQSTGISDTSLTVFWSPLRAKGHRLSILTGIRLPTGSIRETDSSPWSESEVLGYNLQIGSGTVEPELGFSYSGRAQHWIWGAQYQLRLRVYDNARGYRQGHAQLASAWLGRHWSARFATSARAQYLGTNAIRGRDEALRSANDPLVDPVATGGSTLDLSGQLSVHGTRGQFANSALAIEGGATLFNHRNGAQLGSTWLLTAAWQQSW